MEKYIEIAKSEAYKAYKKDEVPIGAVIFNEKGVVFKGHNNKHKKNNIIGHAEINCLKNASKMKRSWILDDYSILVTLEPCLFCLLALEESRIKKIYYLNRNNKSGGLDEYKKIRNELEIIKLDTDYEYEKMLKNFFKNKRN